jgi:glutaredoxin
VADDAVGGAEPVVVTVYWRPGCFFCGRLLGGLQRAGVDVELRNIWEDDEAREFVQRQNRGNETVPTVAFGGAVWTNPEVRTVVEAVQAVRRLPGADRVGTAGTSPGA